MIPPAASLVNGTDLVVSALPICSTNPCPAGVTIARSLSSPFGTLATATGNETVYRAGPAAGTVTVTATARLGNRTSVGTAELTVVRVPAPGPPSVAATPTFLGFPGPTGYLVLIGALLLALFGVVGIWRRGGPRPPDPPTSAVRQDL